MTIKPIVVDTAIGFIVGCLAIMVIDVANNNIWLYVLMVIIGTTIGFSAGVARSICRRSMCK